MWHLQQIFESIKFPELKTKRFNFHLPVVHFLTDVISSCVFVTKFAFTLIPHIDLKNSVFDVFVSFFCLRILI